MNDEVDNIISDLISSSSSGLSRVMILFTKKEKADELKKQRGGY